MQRDAKHVKALSPLVSDRHLVVTGHPGKFTKLMFYGQLQNEGRGSIAKRATIQVTEESCSRW